MQELGGGECEDGFGDPLHPLWDKPELKIHWSPDLHKPILWWATGTFWISSNLCQFRINIQCSPESLIISFSSGHIYLGERPLIHLRKAGGKINSASLGHYVRVLPQGCPFSPSFKNVCVCKLAEIWELIEVPRLCFYDSGWTFEYLIQNVSAYIEQEFSRLPVCFTPMNTTNN